MKKYKSAGFVGLLILIIPLCAYSASSPLDINDNGISDNTEQQVILDHDVSLPAGEYFFKDLILKNSATLYAEPDLNSTNTFKGVKINADNISIENGSSISAYGRGYAFGIGLGSPSNLPSDESSGGSYGGAGKNRTATSTYGSATHPVDLGSAGKYYYGRGGGAIHIVVAGELNNSRS